jgi:hypothetical protein
MANIVTEKITRGDGSIEFRPVETVELYAASDGETATTADAYVTKLQMQVPALVGDYWLDFSMEFASDQAAGRAEIRVIDTTDNVVVNEARAKPINSDDFSAITGMALLALAGAPKVLEVQFRRSSPVGSVTLRRTRMRLRRRI